MKIKCEWVLSNRKGFGRKEENFTPDELKEKMKALLTEIQTVVKEKYEDTKFEMLSSIRLVEWDGKDGEPAHEDVRTSFIISKQGRVGMKEREVYAEVNKIETAYFTKLQ